MKYKDIIKIILNTSSIIFFVLGLYSFYIFSEDMLFCLRQELYKAITYLFMAIYFKLLAIDI